MPFRNAATLQRWLDEFAAAGNVIVGSTHVMEQDGADGADTGLVGVGLMNASAITYMQPEAPDSARWLVTFEPREESIELDADAVAALARELEMVAKLCAFLQAKSAEYLDVGAS